MSNSGENQGEIDPGSIRDLEAKTPNIVRFIRNLVKGGTLEAQTASQYVKAYRNLEEAVRKALSPVLPPALILTAIGELQEDAFKAAIETCILKPQSDVLIRTYVRDYFEAKGVHLPFPVDPKSNKT